MDLPPSKLRSNRCPSSRRAILATISKWRHDCSGWSCFCTAQRACRDNKLNCFFLSFSQFKHENIVTFFGVSFEQQPKYIVLEFLEGGDLKNFLRENRPKPVGKKEKEKFAIV